MQERYSGHFSPLINKRINKLKKYKRKFRLGKYEHYKGKQYEVIGIARHSETLEKLVVYRALYGEHDLWVRPLKMFFETVEVEGKKTPRFRFIEN